MRGILEWADGLRTGYLYGNEASGVCDGMVHMFVQSFQSPR